MAAPGSVAEYRKSISAPPTAQPFFEAAFFMGRKEGKGLLYPCERKEIGMYIIALDQASRGAWAIHDGDTGELITKGSWNFKGINYDVVLCDVRIELDKLVQRCGECCVVVEGVNLRGQDRGHVRTFQRLAQLQGVLIEYCVGAGIAYWIVEPKVWQDYARRCGTWTKETYALRDRLKDMGVKSSKVTSITAVQRLYGEEILNDDVADAVMIGRYAVDQLVKGGNYYEETE